MNKPDSDAERINEQQKEPFELDPAKLQHFLRQVRDNQNLGLGILAGAGAALAGAVGWAAVTTLTGYQVGILAVAVGFLVGLAIRYTGRGIDKIFGIAGAALALLGVVVGNLLIVAVTLSDYYSVSITDVLRTFDFATMFGALEATFSPVDLIFYAIAGYEGYKLSFRKFSAEELERVRATS